MVYYHRLVKDFRLSPVSDHTSRMAITVTIDSVPTSYPATLTDQFYMVVYGYPIYPPSPCMDQVDDDHPVIWQSTTETTTTPTHPRSKEKQKKTTVTPRSHGDQVPHPVHLYCNVGESSIVGNQIRISLETCPIKTTPSSGNRNTCSITGYAGTRWRLWKWKWPRRPVTC